MPVIIPENVQHYSSKEVFWTCCQVWLPTWCPLLWVWHLYPGPSTQRYSPHGHAPLPHLLQQVRYVGMLHNHIRWVTLARSAATSITTGEICGHAPQPHQVSHMGMLRCHIYYNRRDMWVCSTTTSGEPHGHAPLPHLLQQVRYAGMLHNHIRWATWACSTATSIITGEICGHAP